MDRANQRDAGNGGENDALEANHGASAAAR